MPRSKESPLGTRRGGLSMKNGGNLYGAMSGGGKMTKPTKLNCKKSGTRNANDTMKDYSPAKGNRPR